MIRPVRFGFNEQTALSNSFQDEQQRNNPVQDAALKEFDHMAEVLKANGVDVIIVEDTPEPHTPDSIFPNNWISTHSDGSIYLYPMAAENRRHERRTDIVQLLRQNFEVTELTDLSFFESEGKFLEGTGSMVLDRVNKLAYACLSPRTNNAVLDEFSGRSGYKTIGFHAFADKTPIYHTNVMMCLGKSFTVICLESVPDEDEKALLSTNLKNSGKKIIEISSDQMHHFAGNMLQLKNNRGENLLVLSEQAYNSLNNQQISQLGSYCKLIQVPLNTIETSGGGSARCMIAEIHLPRRHS